MMYFQKFLELSRSKYIHKSYYMEKINFMNIHDFKKYIGGKQNENSINNWNNRNGSGAILADFLIR